MVGVAALVGHQVVPRATQRPKSAPGTVRTHPQRLIRSRSRAQSDQTTDERPGTVRPAHNALFGHQVVPGATQRPPSAPAPSDPPTTPYSVTKSCPERPSDRRARLPGCDDGGKFPGALTSVVFRSRK